MHFIGQFNRFVKGLAAKIGEIVSSSIQSFLLKLRRLVAERIVCKNLKKEKERIKEVCSSILVDILFTTVDFGYWILRVLFMVLVLVYIILYLMSRVLDSFYGIVYNFGRVLASFYGIVENFEVFLLNGEKLEFQLFSVKVALLSLYLYLFNKIIVGWINYYSDLFFSLTLEYEMTNYGVRIPIYLFLLTYLAILVYTFYRFHLNTSSMICAINLESIDKFQSMLERLYGVLKSSLAIFYQFMKLRLYEIYQFIRYKKNGNDNDNNIDVS